MWRQCLPCLEETKGASVSESVALFAAECTAVYARPGPCFCDPNGHVCASVSVFIPRDAGVSRGAPDPPYPLVVLEGPASC